MSVVALLLMTRALIRIATVSDGRIVIASMLLGKQQMFLLLHFEEEATFEILIEIDFH